MAGFHGGGAVTDQESRNQNHTRLTSAPYLRPAWDTSLIKGGGSVRSVASKAVKELSLPPHLPGPEGWMKEMRKG